MPNKESPIEPRGGGRKEMTAVPGESLILGVDLGGTRIRTILARPDGTILAWDRRDTSAQEGPEAVLERLYASIAQVRQAPEAAGASILGIGVGAPGPLDARRGVLVSAPNLSGWREVPLKRLIQERIGLPVYLGNDANLGALGEHQFGGGRGLSDMIYVTWSTGIGGGIIANGKLVLGVNGSAGEIGHITIDVDGPLCNCGNRGCLEAMASGTAIARVAQHRLEEGEPSRISEIAAQDPQGVSARAVCEAALQGDTLAWEVLLPAARSLGIGLATLVNLFNPELILIGGGVAQMGERLLGPAREAMRERAFPLPAQTVRIEPATLGDDVGALGGVALVLQAQG